MANVVMTDDGLELRVGDVWYGYLGQADMLCEFRITDLSNQTVEIMLMPHSHRHQRYEIRRIKFVEKKERHVP